MTSKKLYLIDGNAYLHRAYYALPHLTNSQGLPLNAVYGFTRMLLKILRQENPYYVSICFDFPGRTFRHEEFAEYKATRSPMPEDLKVQLPLSKKIVEALNVSFFEKEGYEADDLIATLSREAEKEGIETIVVSGDKDMLQLVNEKIKVLNEAKNILYDLEKVKQTFGIEPKQIVEFMGLAGDSTDNIPGVPGIGSKTAIKLIQEFGTIENLIQNLSQIKGKIREKIENFSQKAQTSKKLATLAKNVPIEIKISDCRVKEINQDKFLKILKEFEFKTLISECMKNKKYIQNEYQIILEKQDFEKMLENIFKIKSFAFEIETTNFSPLETQIIGFSFSLKDYGSFYLPVAHNYLGCPKQLEIGEVLKKLKPILENEEIKKYGKDIKYDLIVLKQKGIDLFGISFDVMIASYLLNPAKQGHTLEDIVLKYLNYKIPSITRLINTGNKQLSLSDVEIEKVANLACNNTSFILQLVEVLNVQLKDKKLEELFNNIEMPLLKVLAEMQMKGFLLDIDYLNLVGIELEKEAEDLKSKIHAQSGEEFNINSSKQLSFILFEKLKLPIIKKSKTGPSTAEDVLKELTYAHSLPSLILRYRELQKLKSTYIDSLLRLVNSKTRRIHSSFNQTITATGRLSSSEPNLQNIPVRTKMGRKIRKSFISEEGWFLVSVDYSQIDLRVLAHFSKDRNLKSAFYNGEDIHTQTASEIFNIPVSEVTADLRKLAKSINFGIVYGMSPYALSQELGISQSQARDYIKRYFTKYKGVKEYIDKTLKEAKKCGYVTTLLNRRRYLAEIQSANPNLRRFAERIAINMPVQGTAADIIKVAMVQISAELKKRNLKSKILLQIHDELIFEVPQGEINLLIQIAKEKMEGAVKMDIPIVVNIKKGKRWDELE